MPIANPIAIAVEEGAEARIVVFRDTDGTELGSVAVDRVPTGIRVEVWHGNDTLAGQVVAHKA